MGKIQTVEPDALGIIDKHTSIDCPQKSKIVACSSSGKEQLTDEVASAAAIQIAQKDNSFAETGADVNRDSLSGCSDADSVACVNGTGLSHSLFVKPCLNHL